MASGPSPLSQLTGRATPPTVQQFPPFPSAPRFGTAAPPSFVTPAQPSVFPPPFMAAGAQPQFVPPQFTAQPQFVPPQFTAAGAQPQFIPPQFTAAGAQPQFIPPPSQMPILPEAPRLLSPQPSILPTAPQLIPSQPSILPIPPQPSILPAAQPIPSVSLTPEQEEEVTAAILTAAPGEIQQAATVIRKGPQRRIPAAETNLAELTYSELDLMPMRCYGCGEVIRQIAIEDALKSGRSLKETLDQLDYPLLCCRDLIRGQVSVLEIEKRRAAEARIRATPLTITSTAQPSTFSLGPGRSITGLRIVDESPPGSVETSIQFPQPAGGDFEPIAGLGESFFQEGATPGDAYLYFMMQTQTEFEGGGGEEND